MQYPQYQPGAATGTPPHGSKPPQRRSAKTEAEGSYHSMSDQEPPPPAVNQSYQTQGGYGWQYGQPPLPPGAPAAPPPPADMSLPATQYTPPGGTAGGNYNQGGAELSDAKRYSAENCLLHLLGEKLVGRAHESPRDCRFGAVRNTVCATNLRVIVNTHLTYLCCVQQDIHASIFYESIYSVRVGQSNDKRPMLYAAASAIVGLFLTVSGFGAGSSGGGFLKGLGVVGLLFLIAGAGAALSQILTDLFSGGSVLSIEYALHKLPSGQKKAVMPAFLTRYIEARLETAECMEVVAAILSHRDTCLLSQGGAAAPQ